MIHVSYVQVCGWLPQTATDSKTPFRGGFSLVGSRALVGRPENPGSHPSKDFHQSGVLSFWGRTPDDTKGLRGPRGRKHPRRGFGPRVLPLVPQGDIPYSPNWGSSYEVAAICTLDAGLINREGDNASAAGRRSGQPIALVKTGRGVRVKGVVQCFPCNSKALIQSLTAGQAGMTVRVGSSLISREVNYGMDGDCKRAEGWDGGMALLNRGRQKQGRRNYWFLDRHSRYRE